MNELIPFEPKIYIVRNTPVMLDRDVAKIYQTTTRLVNLARKRKISMFGSITFKMTKAEHLRLLKENNQKAHNDYNPIAYTEEACYKLATCLESPAAEKMVDLMFRAFKAIKEQKVMILEPKLLELSESIHQISERMKGFNQPMQVTINNFHSNVNYVNGSNNTQNNQQSNNEAILGLMQIMMDQKIVEDQKLMGMFIETMKEMNQKNKESTISKLKSILDLGSSVVSISKGIPEIIKIVTSLF